MKTNKWIWRVLTIVLTLVVLTGVGVAGFRMGMLQGANLSPEQLSTFFAHGRDFDHGMMKSSIEHGHVNFGRHEGFGGRGGFGPLGIIFGLVQLVVLGSLIWLGYTVIKRSGWRLVKASSAPSQNTANETPSAGEEDEKKESA